MNNVTKKVKVSKEVSYDRLKCLLVASYLLGQEMGLRGVIYSHPEAVNQRENLISLIMHDDSLPTKRKTK